jgi:hypothetical protein
MTVSVTQVQDPRASNTQLLAAALGVASDIYKVRLDKKAEDARTALLEETKAKDLTADQRKQQIDWNRDFVQAKDPNDADAFDDIAPGSTAIAKWIPRSIVQKRDELAQTAKQKELDRIAARDKDGKEKSEKAPTEGQVASATYGKRMLLSDSIISELEEDQDFAATGYMTELQRAEIPFLGMGVVPERYKSEKVKKLEQAERNFLTAVLRKESGASISDSEKQGGVQQYFPRPGDTEAVLDQKRQNRLLAVEGMKAGSGSHWDKVNIPTISDIRLSRKKDATPSNSGGGLIPKAHAADNKPFDPDSYLRGQ